MFIELIIGIICILLLLFEFFMINSRDTFNYYVTGGQQHKKNAEFPYRKNYMGDSSVKYILQQIIQSKPVVSHDIKWTIPAGKIIYKAKTDVTNDYYLSNTVVYPTLDDHWYYDIIVDYYSEYARINSRGYGERYTPLDYWNNSKLWNRWKNNKAMTFKDNREAIYKSITEARPAYSTVSKSLYAAFIEMLENKTTTVTILDIAAYGERAIAIAGIPNIEYTGIDPNYDLIQGHDLLLMDLQCLTKNSIQFIHVGIEDFKSSSKFDIISYSPPPYNMELYGSGQQHQISQTYVKYNTFIEYFTCFLMTCVYKSIKLINIDGLLTITALDRNPGMFPIKIHESYRSEHTEMIYVEALLLLISCYGYQYNGAIGLSVGNKSPQVPWFVFKYTNVFDTNKFMTFKKYYSDLWNIINTRIMSNYLYNHINTVDDMFTEDVIYEKTDNYIMSSYMKKNKSSLLMELIRLQIQNYIIETVYITIENKISINKIGTILGRYLMLRSIYATFDQPWKSCLFVDPVFPTNYYDLSAVNDQLIEYFIESGLEKDNAIDIVMFHEYWFKSYVCKGLADLYDTVANYIYLLPLDKVKIHYDNNRVTGNNEALYLFNTLIPKPSNATKKNDNIYEGNIVDNKYIRYKTLGAIGHQYTRTSERTKILEKIFNMPLLDLYASYMNTQSEYYCSLYPDVEENSIGSAFTIKLIQGAYLANPVDIPIFVSIAVQNVIRDLQNTNKKLCISMAFTVWTDTQPDFVTKFKNNDLQIFKNNDVQKLVNSEYTRVVYILDKTKYPSVIQSTVVQNSTRENSISVGVLLTSKPNLINMDYVKELGMFIKIKD